MVSAKELSVICDNVIDSVSQKWPLFLFNNWQKLTDFKNDFNT